jgi:hypothetical protein
LIKSSLLYGSETWRLTENNKRRVEDTEMDALRRSSRISRKDRIRYVTKRQQIVLEETIIKEIKQNLCITLNVRQQTGLPGDYALGLGNVWLFP